MNKLDLQTLLKIKTEADDIFFNSGEQSSLSDEQYDELTAIIERKTKSSATTIGCSLRTDDNRVQLPVHLWSMDKVTDDDKKLKSWLSKNTASQFIIEEKLDGVSCLIVFDTDKDIRMYTRGDGTEGADISYLVPFVRNIPKSVFPFMVRGELIIDKKVFEEKYKDVSANARNMVSGCVNAKTKRDGVDDIQFVAYELIATGTSMPPAEQLIWLQVAGFNTVAYRFFSDVNIDLLRQTLVEMKGSSRFEMDGIIVQPNFSYIRCDISNPKYAIAFKMQTNFAETTVIKVLWEVTKWKLIKPCVEISPVELDGVVIRFITAYNAKYVVDKKLGPGAVIRVTRAGSVIPKIIEVIRPAEVTEMPTVSYKWNESLVDVIVSEEEELSSVKMTADFFDKIGIKGIGEKSVERMYKSGFDSIFKILAMKEDDFKNIDGFGAVSAKKICDILKNGCIGVPLSVLLGSSGVFGNGFGIKKISILLGKIPDLLDIVIPNDELIKRINDVEGFSSKSAMKIIECIPKAKSFLSDIRTFIVPVVVPLNVVPLNVVPLVRSLTYVFSGFRDSDLEKRLVDAGHKVSGTVSNNVDFVIVATSDYIESAKTKKAKLINVAIVHKNNLNL